VRLGRLKKSITTRTFKGCSSDELFPNFTHMFINKNFSLKGFWQFSGGHIIWITCWATAVACWYKFTPYGFSVSWLPVSVIGTAVAFYVGFKNNQAYDRLWEARKIWGGIVNISRAWGSTVKAYLSDQFTEGEVSNASLDEHRQRLIFRHIGWLYVLRNQLLIPTSWEHSTQGVLVQRHIERIKKNFGTGLIDDGEIEGILRKYLPPEEFERLINYKNTATQIIDQQSQDLVMLRRLSIIEDFRHMEMQNLLKEFYELQGKAERIKKFPLPRQYGGMSSVFVGIFIFLLPFGMVNEFMKFSEYGIWISIPFTVLIGWVYMMMELVGDYSENPFEGLGNDIPMLSLCRVIEIDLLEMLGETDLPPAIEAKNGVLM
jgi:putative membrane protein